MNRTTTQQNKVYEISVRAHFEILNFIQAITNYNETICQSGC